MGYLNLALLKGARESDRNHSENSGVEELHREEVGVILE